jgi:two-component system, OmpR family, response regulator MprA
MSSDGILLVEDDEAIASGLQRVLDTQGYTVRRLAHGRPALGAAGEGVGLVILDLGLPDVDGIDVCRRLRAARPDLAILILTARDQELDIVAGLEAGADDYLVKPFHFEELVARVRAVLRRRAIQVGRALRFADLELNAETRQVTRGGRSIDLTPREFDLLMMLIEQPRRVFPKRAILDRVWGYDYPGDDNIVEVYVGYLRDKLDRPFGRSSIETVRGAGYRLRADDAGD